jgi:hypothetical protein
VLLGVGCAVECWGRGKGGVVAVAAACLLARQFPVLWHSTRLSLTKMLLCVVLCCYRCCCPHHPTSHTRQDFERCKIVDKHMGLLAKKYLDARFVKLSAPVSGVGCLWRCVYREAVFSQGQRTAAADACGSDSRGPG